MNARPTCWHCRRPLSPADLEDEAARLHDGRGKPRGRLCGDCTDLAVWGARCSHCEREPSRERCEP
jgi:hypothetical protein